MSDLFNDGGALFSDCGLYRLRLWRIWDRVKPRALLCGLNPSKAGPIENDATIRSDYRLLNALGYGGFVKVNLYGLIATDPRELLKVDDPVGPGNDQHILVASESCAVAVACWGAHKTVTKRAASVAALLRPQFSGFLYCFGTTKAGHPKHPLYLKTGTPLVPFNEVAA